MKQVNAALLILAGIISMASANGVAEEQNKDRTGSPDGSNTCVQCHMGGGFSPTVVITLENELSESVTSLVPGETYTMRVSISNFFPFPDVYGFQATALSDDLSNAGTFSEPGVNVQIENVNTPDIDNRHFIEHNSPSFVGNFESEWTAPLIGDSVYFYAAGVTGNGNSEPEGDNGHNTFLTLPIAEPDGIKEDRLGSIQISYSPEGIQVSHPTILELDELVIHSIDGRELFRRSKLGLPFAINTNEMNSPILLISILDEGRSHVIKTIAL